MCFRLIAAAACGTLALGCAAAAPPIDRLVGFADPHSCAPNEAFAVLLDGLVDHEEAGESYVPVLKKPPIPPEFRAQVGTPKLKVSGREYRAVLPLRGTWQGLPIRSVAVVGWIESEQGFELLFDADRAQVLATANRAGFGIPSSGSEYRDDDVLGLNVGVVEQEGGAALYCIPG